MRPVNFITNTRHSNNVGFMLGKRLRWWTNIDSKLDSCLVFAGMLYSGGLYPVNTKHLYTICTLLDQKRPGNIVKRSR